MIPLHEWVLFAVTSLLLALSPGPNMLYLISRAVCQGLAAGVVSLFGVVSGMMAYMLLTALGLSVIFLAVPLAYDILRFAGAAYLLWLAWKAVRPGAALDLQPKTLPPASHRRLYLTGFITCLLNPKVMVFYLSLLPQFVAPERGSVFAQSLILGTTQIVMAFSAHLSVTLSAARLARWFSGRPRWLSVQRYVLGSVLSALALRLAFEKQQSAA